MMLKKGSRVAPDDLSLVTYADATRELGYRHECTVHKKCRQGLLVRHSSKRGVTRESMQAFAARVRAVPTDTFYASAALRVAQGVADLIGLHERRRDEVACLVLQELIKYLGTGQAGASVQAQAHDVIDAE